MLLNLARWSERQCSVTKRTFRWLSVYQESNLNFRSLHVCFWGTERAPTLPPSQGCEQHVRKYTVNNSGRFEYVLVWYLFHIEPLSQLFPEPGLSQGLKLRWRQDYIPKRKLLEYFPTKFLMLRPLGKSCLLISLTPPAESNHQKHPQRMVLLF